ncbi:MAG: YlbF family regulator [Sedimentisphaerales bacterium]|nr:YlbF family regulator [Sedimentisphaerales bacterium]
MEQLIEMASNLGLRIAAHERTILLKEAQKAVNEDAEAGGLIKQYQQQAVKIGQLEQEQKPVEVADKQKLREIEQKISTNEKLKELTHRQVNFVEMMHKVKQTLDDKLQLEQ